MASKVWALKEQQELRIEVGASEVFLMLQHGAAEVFGAELAAGDRLTVSHQKFAVFTWKGCQLLVEGSPDVIYEAGETPMPSYLNVHQVLDSRREQAKAEGRPGPRCMVVGPTDSGKSALCQLLLNWAVRMGWAPLFADLDVGQGSVTAPGCLSVTPVERPVELGEGYPLEVPLVYFFGRVSPADNPELLRYQVERLASMIDRQQTAAGQAAAGGMVINTMGWVEGLGYELLVHSIVALKVDVVLVMDQDRLYSQLSGRLSGQRDPEVSVVKLHKSGGVVTRPQPYRKEARQRRVREYFYGPQGSLAPSSQTVKAAELHVFRIGAAARAPSSALPLGATSGADPLRVTPVTASNELSQTLLAVSHAQTPDQILSSNVAGFVLVTDVDMARGTLTLLFPCTGQLPGRYLIAGSVQAHVN